MRRLALVCAAAVLAFSGVAYGQTAAPAAQAAPAGPAGPAGEVQRSYASQKNNLLKAAEKMPADQYQYKPTPDVRTFARVVNHVTEAQARSCGVANGTAQADMVKTPADTADKDAIIAGLKASFAECDKAFAATTDTNFTELFTLGQNKRSRAGLMWGTVSHDNEQYSTLAMYLRLKGLVPPSSEK
jgi:ethanolamine utilization microcompartment shell protein EutL